MTKTKNEDTEKQSADCSLYATITSTNPLNIDNVLNKLQSGRNNKIKKNSETESNTKRKKLPASKRTTLELAVPRGLPKSGRPWKEPKKKFSTIKKSIYRNRNAFEKKEALRNDLKHIKQLSTEIKESKKQEKVLKNQRRLENAERRLENERKAEVVQVIKNPSKLKRLKRNQLRQIEKRDFDKVKMV